MVSLSTKPASSGTEANPHDDRFADIQICLGIVKKLKEAHILTALSGQPPDLFPL